MAEEQKEMTSDEVYEDTLSVLENELQSIHENDPEEVVDASTDDKSTDIETPTYKEAEAAQQESQTAASVQSETPTETIPEGASSEKGPELEGDDADVYGNLKPKAQERFEYWINKAKELETANSTLSGSKELQDYIVQSGTNPEQLNWSLNIFNSLNSGNYSKAVAALKQLDSFADQIGERLGVNKTENESTSYGDFEDLSKAVENLEMSEDWANKLASQRTEQNAQYQAQTNFQQYNQQEAQYLEAYQQQANNAYAQITDWEEKTRESDPDYALKSEAMVEVGKRLAQTQFPPQDWLPILQNEYNVLSQGMDIALKQNGNASRSAGPLAPGRNSGGVGNATTLDTAEVTPEFLQAHLDAMHN